MRKGEHLISKVLPGGIAEEMGVEPGMALVSINGEPVRDVLDYRFRISEPHIDVVIRDADGEEHLLEIDQDEDEEFGVEFENPFMDDYRSCANRCIFCFIDQMPKGMRPTLYFKDDDSRLSFLQGNYVTLTNLSGDDLDRIIKYRMEPINVSVQTMNPELRCRMLGNRFAGEALKKLDVLKEAGIVMNGQIVLCKGWNDGDELDATLDALEKYRPMMQSVSVVPVGLTKFREGLTPLEPFGKEEAETVIRQIGRHPHFAYASDEWFALADQPVPEAEYYDGYPQLENGVGMLRCLFDEVAEALAKRRREDLNAAAGQTVSVACGLLFEPYMKRIAELMPDLDIRVYGIRNDFFGPGVTVSGLITGRDFLKQLTGKELGDRVLITVNALRSGETVFLDDMTIDELSRGLGVPVTAVGQRGKDLVDALYSGDEPGTHSKRQVYEK